MDYNQKKITEFLYYIPETNTILWINCASIYFENMNNFHLEIYQKNLERGVFEEDLDKRSSKEF